MEPWRNKRSKCERERVRAPAYIYTQQLKTKTSFEISYGTF